MSFFTQHTADTAPEGASQVLAKVKERYGFIPNLAAYVAEAPGVLDAILNLSGAFEQTSFTPQEQQIVLLTVSHANDCDYCRTVHTALGRKAGLDSATLTAVVEDRVLPDPRWTALRDFARRVVVEQGWVPEDGVQAFLDAGYTRGQVFEVALGVALKTLTNFCNHLAHARPNPEFVAMAADAVPVS